MFHHDKNSVDILSFLNLNFEIIKKILKVIFVLRHSFFYCDILANIHSLIKDRMRPSRKIVNVDYYRKHT